MSDPILARFDQLIEEARTSENYPARSAWLHNVASFLEQRLPPSRARDEAVQAATAYLANVRSVAIVLRGLRASYTGGDMRVAEAPGQGTPNLFAELELLIRRGEEMPEYEHQGALQSSVFVGWQVQCIGLLELFPDSPTRNRTAEVVHKMPPLVLGRDKAVAVLRSFLQFESVRARHEPQRPTSSAPALPPVATPFDDLRRLCDRFHAAAVELRSRPQGRRAFKINDEYDVQYLLGALLQLHFSNVTPEDPMPRNAGASSRVDFLLADHGVVVETKMTRANLGDRRIGEELIIDSKRFRQAGRKALFCFVYDPEHLIRNAAELEASLRVEEADFRVELMIRPKR